MKKEAGLFISGIIFYLILYFIIRPISETAYFYINAAIFWLFILGCAYIVIYSLYIRFYLRQRNKKMKKGM